MKTEIHIFICFNPMVNIYISALIRQLKLSEYLVVEFYSNQIITNVKEEKVKRYIYSGTFDYLRNLKNCVQFINKETESYNRVYFYFSHPFHMLSNTYFFSGNRKFHFVQIPDGIANYYNVTTLNFLPTMLVKKITSIFIHLKYSMYLGHLTGVQCGKYDYLITLYEKGFINAGQKTRLISIDDKKNQLNGVRAKNILVLGQSYKNYKYYRSTYLNIFNFIESEFESQFKIYYKKHPNENLNNDFMNLLRKYNIEMENNNKQVELFGQIYKTIISEASSALFNLKILYGEKIDCIAYLKNVNHLSGRRISHKHIREIKQQLQNVGVTIIE